MIYVCRNGDVTQLNAEAIVNSTNEALNDRNLVSDRILMRAGPGLRKELRTVVKSKNLSKVFNCSQEQVSW